MFDGEALGEACRGGQAELTGEREMLVEFVLGQAASPFDPARKWRAE